MEPFPLVSKQNRAGSEEERERKTAKVSVLAHSILKSYLSLQGQGLASGANEKTS